MVATRVVWIGDRMFRIEIRKCLKGNLTGRYDCAYYEDKELEKGKNSDANFWRNDVLSGSKARSFGLARRVRYA